jgi:uncharacterized cupredoxin-like copper-binding protein
VVRSGERADVRFEVPASGELLIGCHIPGHYDRGMVVPIRLVTPGAARA